MTCDHLNVTGQFHFCLMAGILNALFFYLFHKVLMMLVSAVAVFGL